MRNIILLLVMILGNAYAQHPQGEADMVDFIALLQESESDVYRPLHPQILTLAERLNNTEANFAVGYQLYLRGEYRACLTYCYKCEDLRPMCFSAILLEGLAQHRLGQRQQALARLLLCLDPEQCYPTKDVELDRDTEAVLVAIGSRLSEEHYKRAKHWLTTAN